VPYTIQLCFSAESQSRLDSIFRELDSPITRKGDRPHLSLTVYDASSEDGIADLLEEIAEKFTTFSIQFSAVGLFPGPENVVFLAPIVTRSLLDIHTALHQGLDRLSITSRPHYRPQAWVPHVGVSMGIAADRDRILRDAMAKPLWGPQQISAVEFIRFLPGKLLHRVELNLKEPAQGGTESPSPAEL